MTYAPIPFPVPEGYQPSAADLRKYDTPGQQQAWGSCTGDCAANAYENMLRQKGPEYEEELSRMWIWYYGRAYLGLAGTAMGATVEAVVKALAEYGVCPEQKWKYVDANVTALPLGGDVEPGKPYLIGQVYSVDSVEALFAALDAGKPVLLATKDVFDGYAHAVVAVGYSIEKNELIIKDANMDGNGSFYKTLPLDQAAATYDRWTFDLGNPPVVAKWKKYAILRFLMWFYLRFIAGPFEGGISKV